MSHKMTPRKYILLFVTPLILGLFCVASKSYSMPSNPPSPIAYTSPNIKITQVSQTIIIYPSPPSWVKNTIVLFIMKECEKSNVPYLLIFKMIEYESGWNQSRYFLNKDNRGKIVSIDYGYLMINSLNIKNFIHSFKDSNRKESSYDVINNVYDNIQIGIRYLRSCYDQTGSWTLAVTAYNAGPANAINGTIGLRTKQYVNYIIPIENWWTFPDTVKVIRRS